MQSLTDSRPSTRHVSASRRCPIRLGRSPRSLRVLSSVGADLDDLREDPSGRRPSLPPPTGPTDWPGSTRRPSAPHPAKDAIRIARRTKGRQRLQPARSVASIRIQSPDPSHDLQNVLGTPIILSCLWHVFAVGMSSSGGIFATMTETSRAALIQNAAAGPLNGWPRSDILALSGVAIGAIGSVAAVIAIMPQSRHIALRLWCAMLLRSGLRNHQYAKWFVATWGVYANPYLGEYEKLDLRSTYVPLSFMAGDAQSLILANQVLARRAANRLIIIGDPGSGKSTLLKAYGVGLLRNRRRQGDDSRVVPYYVQLRKLAKFLAPGKGNTRDFRCLWGSGALLVPCSVSVFESVFVLASPGWGHAFCPRVARGWRAVPRFRGPGGAVPPP